ncbi:NAD-dependent epimerase/dehydratase [Methanofollis liminatans DSM 4140]|uniref:NAD-dependent epimerase/dehydratase n=1 Tax=Methanofollis liminatans DSM 4140 TaxID=28892 RepID=J1L294_9EURY|nr:SDR family oxidoreductase [Methanofollis liminatans]EJG06790.1 NAD-dependent epimerase/dehydratase [Methanofollis liminatans DSM 4140]
MKYIITGGAGFIGSNLSEELAQHHDVIILDNISTGRMENLQGLIKRGDVAFVRGDINDTPLLENLFTDADGVFHQAALPSVQRSVKNPMATHEANVTGTLNVLLAARDAGVRKVVMASSSSVYGNTPTLPKHEGMIPSPLSPYAVSKIADEYYASVFSDLYGLQTVCLRYFNVFGPHQDPNSQYAAVIPNFVKQILAGRPPVIYGDGGQTRDFTYIKNVVQANIKSMENDAQGAFNIACGERIDLLTLARTIMEIVGTDVEPVHEAPRPGDVRDSLADISRAQAAFGYAPQYDLKAGLKETIAWFRNH